jgi:hypothetical protein
MMCSEAWLMASHLRRAGFPWALRSPKIPHAPAARERRAMGLSVEHVGDTLPGFAVRNSLGLSQSPGRA